MTVLSCVPQTVTTFFFFFFGVEIIFFSRSGTYYKNKELDKNTNNIIQFGMVAHIYGPGNQWMEAGDSCVEGLQEPLSGKYS